MKSLNIFYLIIGFTCISGICDNACSNTDISSNLIKYFSNIEATNSTMNFQGGQIFVLDLNDLKEELKDLKDRLKYRLQNYNNTQKIFSRNEDNISKFRKHLERIDNEFMNICTKLHEKYKNIHDNFSKYVYEFIELLAKHMELSSISNNYYEEYIRINKDNEFVRIKKDIPQKLVNKFIELINRENDKQFYLFGKELEQEYERFKKHFETTYKSQSATSDSLQKIVETMKNIELKNLKNFETVKLLINELGKNIDNFKSNSNLNEVEYSKLENKLKEVSNLITNFGLNDNAPGIDNLELKKFQDKLINYKQSLYLLKVNMYYNVNETTNILKPVQVNIGSRLDLIKR